MSKAEEIVEKFKEITFFIGEANETTPIQCAIIHVEGIIEAVNRFNEYDYFSAETVTTQYQYWQEVLKELKQM